MKKSLAVLILLVGGFGLISTAIAHEADEAAHQEAAVEPTPEPGFINRLAGEDDLEKAISTISFRAVAWASLALVVLIGLAMMLKRSDGPPAIIFWLILAVVLAASGILIGATVYLNNISLSKGPVHWHADFEVWACGQQLELADPTGFLSNKVGTATLHEHNDQRIHLEGVVVNHRDASLGKFFQVTGGLLTANTLVLPTPDGTKTFTDGQNCGVDPAELQVFAYHVESDHTYTQSKLSDPAAYKIRAESNVPPGDCIIVEFDQPKDRTEHVCQQYGYAQQRGELKGENR